MRTLFKISVVILILYLPEYAIGQENLDSLLKIAATNNPALKAKYNKYLADLQKIPQVGTLSDPELSFGFFIKPMQLMSGRQTAQIQLMQMFPWFGLLKASRDEASAMALSSFELFIAERDQIFFDVRNSYYQLYLINKQIQIDDTTLVLLKSIEMVMLNKIKTIDIGNNRPGNNVTQPPANNNMQNNSSMNGNQGNQQGMSQMGGQGMPASSSVFADLLRLQIEMRQIEDNIAGLKNMKRMLIIKFNTLLNRKPEMEISLPDSIPVPDFEIDNSLYDSIIANNPMIKMNKSDIEAYQKKQLMAKKMGYPMVGLGLNYMLINKSEMSANSEMNGKDMIMPMVKINLPIFRKKYNGAVKEAQLLEDAANEQLTNTENMLYMEYSGYLFAYDDAQRQLKLYDEIIDLTQKSFNLVLIQYSTSLSDFEALIRLEKQLLDYKLNLIKVKVDKLTAIAGFQKLLSQN